MRACPIYGQFAAIWKSDSAHIVYKIYILLIVTFYLTEPENKIKISQT